MDKIQLRETTATSWKVAAAMMAVVLGLIALPWVRDTPWAMAVILFVAAVAALSGILGLWAQVRLIRWSDDPKCPWGMYYEYEAVASTSTKPPGTRYRFDTHYPGTSREHEFRCNSSPVDIEVTDYLRIGGGHDLRTPFPASVRQKGKRFTVDAEERYVSFLEVTVRAEKEIHILKVRPLNSAWYRLWERLKCLLRVKSRDPAEESGED